MNINILGTDYSVNLISRDEDPRFLDDIEMSGLCDFTSKKINIVNQIKESEGASCLQDNLEEIEKQVLLHELSHAFLRESGLDTESRDEHLCDWLSIQIPKIFAAYLKGKSLIEAAHEQERTQNEGSVSRQL